MTLIGLRDARDDEIPRNARSLAEHAVLNGWTVRTTYCRGPLPTKLDPDRHVTSVAVRLCRGTERLAALWNDGKFWCALAPFETFTLTSLRARVATRPADEQVAA